ncbi:hypothetical protein CCH79_00013368 [Gambusia affinis]|uniref:B30.2/SPRY domain-containing protein n=1 Tax=Gambusia affinis TaxID=33528 RepID=A0A315W8Z5_GAMAF|nr:hypothetical protein CCH79_00013368 [Gambusia affinis]
MSLDEEDRCFLQLLPVNLMQIDQPTSENFKTKTKEPKSFHENAVDKALGSTNGHLDLFLRFFLGLSLQSNQSLLLDLFTQTKSNTEIRCKTVRYIKEKISENVSAEKSINLFHCLNELNDRSLVEEIQQSLSSGSLSTDELSPAQWSALAYILLSSGQDLDEFDLKKYSASEEAFLRLLPVIKISSKALLSVCNLSVRSCEALSTVLRTAFSCLRDLDLSNNNLQDAGVKLVAAGLKSPTCELQILRLSGCLVTEEGCLVLSAALTFNPSHLRELDLSYNHPGNTGVEVLSAHLQDPGCTLENLRVEPAGVQWLTPDIEIRKKNKEHLDCSLSPSDSCQLSIDTNTVSRKMRISGDGRKVTHVAEDELYPDHPDRFDVPPQFLCRDGLSGRGYWEVEWGGQALIAVSYKKIQRKGNTHDCLFAWNDHSWSLRCSDNGVFSVLQNKAERTVSASSSSISNRVAVYVDCPAGTLSFYRVSSGSLVHLHTFSTTFTEPLYPGFGFGLLYTSDCCSLTFDSNTVHRNLKLSDDGRFDGWWPQLLCSDGLTGRCYWEVEWSGVVYVSVSYRGISRRGYRDCMFGWNDQSWNLRCCDLDNGYSVWHNNKGKLAASSHIDPAPSDSASSDFSDQSFCDT